MFYYGECIAYTPRRSLKHCHRWSPFLFFPQKIELRQRFAPVLALGSTLTNHSICFHSASATFHLAWNFSQLDGVGSFLECATPAAAANVATVWMWEREAVRMGQRLTTLCRSWIADWNARRLYIVPVSGISIRNSFQLQFLLCGMLGVIF